MKQTKYIIGGIIVVILGLSLFYINHNNQKTVGQDNNLPTLSVGLPTSPGFALVMVAKDKGFDIKNGINMDVKEFTAGKFALQAFLGGSLDVVISGDTPVVFSTIQGNEFLVAGQVVAKTNNATRVVARKDGSTSAKDYFSNKKRKLATSFGGGPEFFTYQFLNSLGIDENEVELVSQQPADMPSALTSGSIDAIAIFDPFASFAEEQLGEDAITFTDENLFSEFYVIDVHESIKDNPEKLEKFLQSLLDAEQFIKNNSEESKQIVMKYTKLEKNTIDKIWNNFDFQLTITPELIESWNEQVNWAIKTNKVEANIEKPNFRDIIYDAPLKKIAPDAVKI